MRIPVAARGLLLALAAVAAGAADDGPVVRTIPGPSGAAVTMSCRRLIPGEPVLFTLADGAGAAEATVVFLDQTVTLSADPAGGRTLGFAGIDLNVKPGRYPVSIAFTKDGGGFEGVREDIEIGGRDFPEKRLQVKQEFVTPPAEVRERLRMESEMVAWAYRQISPIWLGEGGFALPHPGRMAPNFGEKRIYNGVPRSVHSGVDIGAGLGQPILASNAGRVVLASDLYMSGKTVIVDHGLGVFTSYLHMSELLVKRQQLVDKGELLGRAGSTGRSTGPHLHWSVRVFDSRVDPRSLLELPLAPPAAAGARD